jgi:pyridoxal 5'-phosphate synthase pdxS subunit
MEQQGQTGTVTVKRGLAQMLKGGVIMDVVTPEQAAVAQEAGAVAVMALERIPSDIRAAGGVARMSSLELIQGIMDAVTIPVMAKVRIGHFAEAQVLQSIGVDYIDESEVLTPADDLFHVDKHQFTTPFVCGARDLGEALRRITEGAAMIRSKGEAGSGNIVEAVRHIRAIKDAIATLKGVPKEELVARARDIGASYELVREVAEAGKLPVVLFCAGGVSTPADASLMMQLGAEGIFVGSGIFKSNDPKRFARAIVDATTHYNDPKVVADACRSLGLSEAMPGIDVRKLAESELLATRGN